MATYRDLQNIVYGMVTRFASRYNEYMGYWYLGFLRTACEQCGQTAMSIDLLGKTMRPEGPESQGKLIVLHEDLRRRLTHHGLDIGMVRSASILIQFGVTAPPQFHATSWWGDPTSITMTVEDDRGKTYQTTVFVSCAPHDPNKEARSGK